MPQSHHDTLTLACRAALVRQLPAGLRATIARELAGGTSRRELLRRCRLICGGRRSLTMLALEALLGCDEYGRLPEGA